MNPPLSFGINGEQKVTAPIVVGGADDEDVGATVLLGALEDGARTVVVGQPVAAAAGRSVAAPTEHPPLIDDNTIAEDAQAEVAEELLLALNEIQVNAP